MNIKQLKAKLEDMDYGEVHQIWDEYCRLESPNQWQLISEIIDIAESDEDVFKMIEMEVV